MLIPIELITAASGADARIHKKVIEFRIRSPVISNKKMKHVMKIVKSLQYFGVLLEIALKQLRMKQKSKKVDLLVVSPAH